LLFIEARNKISLYKKGTPDYEKMFMKLKSITYATGEGEEEEHEQSRINTIHRKSVISRSRSQANSIMSIKHSEVEIDIAHRNGTMNRTSDMHQAT